MISKELISSVLNVNCTECESAVYGGMLGFKTDNRDFNHLINVYELAHKCKEWALSKNNLELISAITEEGAYCQIDNIVPSTIRYDINQMDTSCRTVFNSIIFDEDTEPEAIFKATSYIMEQLKQKD